MRTSLDFFENGDYPSIRRQIDRLRRRRAPKRRQPFNAYHEDDIVTAFAHSPITTVDDTLASLLHRDAVAWPTLHARYGPLLELVRVIIGVVPNCDRYLEIWPPAFRTYNLLVPNLLNLPFTILGFGSAPKEIVGMGMYVASRAAECPYCSAHTCSFALRRGASPEKMAQALVGGSTFTPEELATVAVARSLARIPCELIDPERQALIYSVGAVAAEWIVLGVVVMGFLNKFMDAISVELEASAAAEVVSTMGANFSLGKAGRALDAARLEAPPQPDSLFKKLSTLRYVPAALRLDRQWQRGTPDTWPAVGDYLLEKTGHDFPVLSRLRNRRAIRAIASALVTNLDATTTLIGLEMKVLAGVIFAIVIKDEALATELRQLGARHGVSNDECTSAAEFAADAELEPPASEPKVRAAWYLARAVSPSPAAVTHDVVQVCRDSGLSAAAIVELVTWVSVLQMLHRVSAFFINQRHA